MHRRILEKAGLLIALGGFVTMGSVAQAELRKFSNPDGSKNFQAELVHYLPDKKIVQVRRKSGKLMKFRLDAVSKEDQKYVLDRAPLLDIANDLKVNAKIQIGKKERVKSPPFKNTTTPKSYRVTFRNTSDMALEDLDVEYEIHWVKDNGTGRKGEVKNVLQAKTLVSSVMPREEFSFNTDAVKIVYKEPYGST